MADDAKTEKVFFECCIFHLIYKCTILKHDSAAWAQWSRDCLQAEAQMAEAHAQALVSTHHQT